MSRADEESVDDIFDTSIDKYLQLSDCGSSPIISSGVSSNVSKGSKTKSAVVPVVPVVPGLPGPPPDAEQLTYKCTRDKCKAKPYKTETGFRNHMFVHKMQDVNKRKPTKDEIFPHMPEFLVAVLNEMLGEPNIAQEKTNLLQETLNSKGSESWNIFVESISDLICGSLAKRTKLLPSNQYEEFQYHILNELNDSDTFSVLKLSLMELLFVEKFSAFIGNVVYRLVVRLGEVVQSFLITKMKSQTDIDVPAIVPMSQKEEKHFKMHISYFLKNYYLRAISLKNEVWEARSLCLRNRFVINVEGEPVGRQDILDNSLWENEELDISENALIFFKGIENILRSVQISTGKYSLENVLEKLIDPCSSNLLVAFHFLVTGYLGEKDTLSFLREMVQLFYTISIRKEQEKILKDEGAKVNLTKHSLRGSMQQFSLKTAELKLTEAQPDKQPSHSESEPQGKGKKRCSANTSKAQIKDGKTSKIETKTSTSKAQIKDSKTSKKETKTSTNKAQTKVSKTSKKETKTKVKKSK